MIRLIHIEWLKLKYLKAVWVLIGLYLIALLAICLSAKFFLDYITDQGVAYNGINPSMLPVYAFDDIWQNIAYLASYFKIFPAFILIISVSNEFSYRTHRQNIIDGLSRAEFFYSKLSFAAFLSLLSAAVLLLIGLVMGALYSDVTGMEYVLENIVFIPVHALQFFIYFLFAILLVLLIRKSGITIVLLLLYTLAIEPVAAAVIGFALEAPLVAAFLPMQAIGNLVPMPFGKYMFQETQTYVGGADLAIAAVWTFIYAGAIYLNLTKRDF
jgi:hypothetical protein